TEPGRGDPDGDGVIGPEGVRTVVERAHTRCVLVDVPPPLVVVDALGDRGRPGEHRDVPATAVGFEVDGDPWAGGDVGELGRAGLREEQETITGPQEPHGRGDGSAVE